MSRPVADDWIRHDILSWIAYGGITAAGLILQATLRTAPLINAGAILGLLVTGIHHSRDVVTYHVVVGAGSEARGGKESG